MNTGINFKKNIPKTLYATYNEKEKVRGDTRKQTSAETCLWHINLSCYLSEVIRQHYRPEQVWVWAKSGKWVNSSRVNPLWNEDDLSLTKSSVNTRVFTDQGHWAVEFESPHMLLPRLSLPCQEPPQGKSAGRVSNGLNKCLILQIIKLHSSF